MIVYQKPAGDADAGKAVDPAGLVQDLKSSNKDNPAVFIDRPAESQGPIYTDVDGSSDNTFDILPSEVEGAAWIATRRLSDPKMKTDLEFRINPSSKEQGFLYSFHGQVSDCDFEEAGSGYCNRCGSVAEIARCSGI